MEIQKYKNMIEAILFSDDMDYGFVSGNKYQFYVRADQYRIIWDRKNNTVILPILEEPTPTVMDKTQLVISNPVQMVARLKSINPTRLYYVPTSKEDEFQASTAYDGHILPFELVRDLERLLMAVREDIGRYSVNARIY